MPSRSSGGPGSSGTETRLEILKVKCYQLSSCHDNCDLGGGFRGIGRGSVWSRLGTQRLPEDLVLTNLTAEGPKPARVRVMPPPKEDDDQVVMDEGEEEDLNLSEGTKDFFD